MDNPIKETEFITLKWSPDGNKLALASYDVEIVESYIVNPKIQIIDAQSKKVVLTIEEHANSVEWKYDGSEFASGGDPGIIRRWDAQTGKLLAEYRHTSAFLFPDTATPVPVYAINYRPDGKIIASGGLDNVIRLWDSDTGSITNTIDIGMTTSLDLKKGVNWLGWNISGTQFACTNWDGILRIWNSLSEPPILSLVGHQGSLTWTAWSPDSLRIASAGIDRTIRIWDTTSGEVLRILRGHTKDVGNVCWSADGSRVASASEDSTIKIWDTKTGQNISTILVTDGVWALDWASDGRLAFAPTYRHKISYDNYIPKYHDVPVMPIILRIDDQSPPLIISGYS